MWSTVFIVKFGHWKVFHYKYYRPVALFGSDILHKFNFYPDMFNLMLIDTATKLWLLFDVP